MAVKVPQTRAKIIEAVENLPPGVKEITEFTVGVGIGAALAPIYTAIVGGELVKTAWAPDKVEHLKLSLIHI